MAFRQKVRTNYGAVKSAARMAAKMAVRSTRRAASYGKKKIMGFDRKYVIIAVLAGVAYFYRDKIKAMIGKK